MLIQLRSPQTVAEAGESLRAAVTANHFGVLHVHNLKETLARKGVTLERECLVFEVCQPQQAQKVLEHHPSVSTALPCRISIYEEGGETFLTTLKPTKLLSLYGVPDLVYVAQEIEDTLLKIMTEAVKA